MSTRNPAITTNATSDPVIAWRVNRLIGAGVPRELARTVAADGGYDLHAVLDLIDSGCPPKLALRILAPLKGRARADRPEPGLQTGSLKGEHR